MNRPQPLAGANVETADVAARPFLVRRTVVNAGADHDHVAADHRRGADRIVRRAHRVRQRAHQVDAAAVAEALVGRAGLRVERDQVGVVRAEQQAVDLAVRPIRQAAMHVAEVAGPSRLPVAGIHHPDRLAGRRIDRRDLPERRHGVEDALDHQWRIRIPARSRCRVRFDDGVVRRGPSPGDRQLADGVLVDLIERRILVARGVAAVVSPLRRAGLGPMPTAGRSAQERHDERESTHRLTS